MAASRSEGKRKVRVDRGEPVGWKDLVVGRLVERSWLIDEDID